MRIALPLYLSVGLLWVVGCDNSPMPAPSPAPTAPTAPTGPPAPPKSPTSTIIATYLATLSASPSCNRLPPEVKERFYTVSFYSDGAIFWSSAAIANFPGHGQLSAGTIADNVLSFYIDVPHGPQSDAFNGIWEDLGQGTFFQISGIGNGAIGQDTIAGPFEGVFAFYASGLTGPPSECFATDHHFTWVKQS